MWILNILELWWFLAAELFPFSKRCIIFFILHNQLLTHWKEHLDYSLTTRYKLKMKYKTCLASLKFILLADFSAQN
jgi:hypothetical protein